MADLQTVPETVTRPTADDDDLTHTVCVCDPGTALCGADLREAEWDDDGTDCLVCEDLNDYYDGLGTCCRLGAEHDCG